MLANGSRARRVRGVASWDDVRRLALGAAAPDGPILGARVEHLGAKEALLADDPAVLFTTPHFDGYPAILIRLEQIAIDELEELVDRRVAGPRAQAAGRRLPRSVVVERGPATATAGPRARRGAYAAGSSSSACASSGG